MGLRDYGASWLPPVDLPAEYSLGPYGPVQSESRPMVVWGAALLLPPAHVGRDGVLRFGRPVWSRTYAPGGNDDHRFVPLCQIHPGWDRSYCSGDRAEHCPGDCGSWSDCAEVPLADGGAAERLWRDQQGRLM